jgi:hypothetical protein
MLAFLFWPESTQAQARTNVCALRQRLRAAPPQADASLSLDPQAVPWCQ